MRKIQILLTSLATMVLIASTATSCLDKYPEHAIPADKAINTLEELDQAAIGVYAAFKSSALYSGYLTLLPDIQCDLAYAINGYTNIYGNIWRWDILATNSEITAVYASLYDVIARANFLLEYAPRVELTLTTDQEIDSFNQICGEAYFARALAYSELIKLYCKAYESKEQADAELGVVLVTKYNTEEPMMRATLQDSYERVIKDLDKAAELMDIDEKSLNGNIYNATYFNEYTAYALRARVALYMKDYEAAIDYSSKVIDSGYYILSSATTEYTSGMSYFTYMWQYDDATEIIWKVGFTLNSYGGALGSIFFNYDYSSMKPDYVPAEWVLGLYDTNDLRYGNYFYSYTTGHSHGLTWPLLVKYFGNMNFYQSQILHTSMPKPLRLAEQHLIRAEAYAEGRGNYALAGEDIATLREARYASFGGGVSMTEDNAMQIIQEERVKELYMEGFRLMDLKRWHKGFERTPQSESLESGSSLKVEADDPRFVWPIPQHELESPGSMILPNESNR
ncbi:MAG: RagB/SusD family nutrient uptake outer membrane protein [Alistipes sp.]|nr:RagB/SusD family nutrient uptake outer membrane protein [Alistipes sp.]